MASKYYYYKKIYTGKNKPQGYPNPNFKVNFNGNDINNLGIEPYISREEALRLINKYKNNYKQCGSVDCAVGKFQSYNAVNFGKTVQIKSPITCNIDKLNLISQYNYQKYVLSQQNLYALMRRFPEKFPIIPSVKGLNLTIPQQKAYSNNWYRQIGTSQSMPINDVWGGTYIPGSEVPYTN